MQVYFAFVDGEIYGFRYFVQILFRFVLLPLALAQLDSSFIVFNF
jgi:hypothetical protein